MLSFLLKQIWIGIEFFLNFYTTFVSVLGLQITVTIGSVFGLQDCKLTLDCSRRHNGSNGSSHLLQWEQPFVAGTMLRRPEPTKERVESTILSVIAIEIKPLTRFALQLLLRILRYMWRNHVATWTKVNNWGRNLDFNKIWFSHLHYFLQFSFWFGFESEKLKSLYSYLEKT